MALERHASDPANSSCQAGKVEAVDQFHRVRVRLFHLAAMAPSLSLVERAGAFVVRQNVHPQVPAALLSQRLGQRKEHLRSDAGSPQRRVTASIATWAFEA